MDTIISKTKKQRISAGFLITMTVVVVAHLVVTYILYRRLDNVTSRYEQTVAHNISMDKIWLKRFEPVYIEIPNTLKIKALREDYKDPDSTWILVNKNHPLKKDYIPKNLMIAEVGYKPNLSEEEKSIRKIAIADLEKMFIDAKNEGINLIIGSGYRSIQKQSMYFNSLVSKVGYTEANKTIAVPGESEHHTGLSVDISTELRDCYLESCFKDTKDGMWLKNNSFKYGFILRYPEGKESITGYSYEPWHFRYLGIDLAKAIHDSKLTFEEVQPYLDEALNKLKLNKVI